MSVHFVNAALIYPDRIEQGFVTVEGMEEDIFIPESAANGAAPPAAYCARQGTAVLPYYF